MKVYLVGRCPSCLEKHPESSACPPHEVRLRGTAWFREYIADLEAEVEQLWAAINKHRRDVWGDGRVEHESDEELYRIAKAAGGE